MAGEQGYRVSRSMLGLVPRYTAWAPAIEYDALRRAMRERYAVGERVPEQRAVLGVFESAADAMAACEAHALGVVNAG